MTSIKKPCINPRLLVSAAISLAVLGFGLTACSPAAQEPSNPTATTATAAPALMETAAPSAATSAGRKISMQVTGAQGNALVKAIVVTADGKETGGEMTQQTLPFTQELTLPAATAFTKVLVLAKYASGVSADISCSISIDGKEVASNSSNGRQPAQCLFLEK